ncbi:hypothetical protein PR202_ga05951 [Eleusine coracana subsp. coracana]|uniref:DUF1421 domain-containing protein n=1 Tax=Eleusine coracana subsp. coracana TaxID=191504 RepID=A0AAV5BVP3_ELECO|nr:hypothetical protein PR202_ga05951 [Eleusine coracana subsp. coracana]
MASPARPAAASVSGAFGLSPDPKRCSFDQALRREDFQEKRLLMSFVNFHEQEKLSKKIVTEAIEDCMKKQADNLLQSLDVISGRLSQLELYCYKLERSIGELRSDVMDYHGEATLNFRCLEKNVKEVQKSVQVLQDKQELAETQKELSKLQIIHEDGQKSEGTAPSVLMTRDELALVPLHQVNAGQSPMQFQSCNGVILQQLVPVSLSTQPDQQRSSQTTMYCMQGQNHLDHRQAQPVQAAAHSLQPHPQNPQPRTVVEVPHMTSQAPEFYLQPQQQWPQTGQQVQSQARQPQPQVVQHQQYSNVQVPSQVVHLQTSSPQAHSAPQVTLVYPPYGSHQPACVNTEARTRGMVVQPSYSTISSPQRKNHEVAPIYVQSSSISVPMAEQPQQFHTVSNGSFGPQANKLAPCSVASYMVPGSAQTYNTAYGSPSSNPPTVVAVVNQQSQTSAPMMLHHLGPQAMQNHRVDMAERAARMGYSKDQAESIALRMVAAGHPTEFNTMHDRLSSVSNVVTPQAWSG